MDAPSATPRADPPAPPGELIVHTGRLSGARKALNAVLTVIGRADGCDVRLNADAVHPAHCAVARGPDGLVLRALDGAVTLVNGAPVSEGPLHDGDLLAVGPFQFRVAVAPLPEPLDPAALRRERDALRIQAAAVAAQQAALTDDESKLQHRRVALERQEAQVAAHLDERRKQLVEMQGQVREARMKLREERAEHEKRVAETTGELARVRRAVKAGEDKLGGARRRLAELHKRLKRRYAAHGKAARAGLKVHADRLAEDRRKLDAERAALNEARLRFNGESELGRRQLQDGRTELRRARREWEERRRREDADFRRRCRDLADAERGLADQRLAWEEARRGLQQEAEGLEARVRNLRRKAHEQEQEARGRGAAPAPAAGTPDVPAPVGRPSEPPEPGTGGSEGRPPNKLPAGAGQQLAALEALAGELADQRLHLLEQTARLAQAQEAWRGEQMAALVELDAAGRRLVEHEAMAEPRARALAEAEAGLRRRGELAAQVQAHLDGWQARLTAREAAWQAERQAMLAEVTGRDEAAKRQAAALADLRRRWSQRRKKEVESLRAETQRCGAARRQYAALWEECLNRSAALEQQQRALAEQSLALEQYRLELIGRSPDSAAAEKRLERLRRRCAAPTAAARRNLDQQREALARESERLQELAQRLDKRAAALEARQAELSRRLTAGEEEQAGAAAAAARTQAELRSVAAQRDRYEREAQALRDEVERLARLLMDDAPALLPGPAQAA